MRTWTDIETFLKIYETLKFIARSILEGVNERGKLGEISHGSQEGEYLWIDLDYEVYYDEMFTKSIKVPYSILDNESKIKKFIAQQITDFYKV